MFGGRFSHQRFSMRGKTVLEVGIKVFFVENVHSMISLGSNTIAESNFRETIHQESELTRGSLISAKFREDTQQESQAFVDFRFAEDFAENIENDIFLSSDFYIKNNYQEAIDSNFYLGKDITFAEMFQEMIQTKIFLGKNIYSEMNVKEEVHSVVSVDILDKDILVINVSIPPGSEIRIDSEAFTVTLDGKNIMHNHTGDWIQISRALLDLTITNGFQGTLLYQERFL